MPSIAAKSMSAKGQQPTFRSAAKNVCFEPGSGHPPTLVVSRRENFVCALAQLFFFNGSNLDKW